MARFFVAGMAKVGHGSPMGCYHGIFRGFKGDRSGAMVIEWELKVFSTEFHGIRRAKLTHSW